MNEKRFCPNCGTQVKPDADFCPNCGTRISQPNSTPPKRQEYKAAIKAQPQRQVNNAQASRQPMKKKTKILIGIGIMFLAAFIVFYAWGTNHYTRANQIDRIRADLVDTKADFAKDVVADNSTMQVTDSSLKPMQTYFSEHQGAADKLMNKVNNEESLFGIRLVQSGHHLLFFPKYVLRVPTYRPAVATNHADSEVSLEGKPIGKVVHGDFNSQMEYGKELPRLFMGTYHVKVKSNISGRTLSVSSTNDIGSNDTIDLAIRTESFTVKSIPGAKLFLNDKEAGILDKNGKLSFKNYPVTDKLRMYVEAKIDKKTIRSESINYGDLTYDSSDNHKTYEPTWKGLIDKETAENILEENFKNPDEDYFVNGAENKSYQELRSMVKGFDNDDDIEDYEMECQVVSITPASNSSSNVVYKITYTFTHEDYERKQVMLYKGASFHSSGNEDQDDDDDYDSDNGNQKIRSIGSGKIISDKKY